MKPVVSTYFNKSGYSALGCSYWYKHVKWPYAMFVEDCCGLCHTGLCTTTLREVGNFKFEVCCKVGNLCLKKVAGYDKIIS